MKVISGKITKKGEKMTNKNQNEGVRWCYGESTPYSIEKLGDEAWPTGCPLCGNNCWEKLTPEQKVEANEFYSAFTSKDLQGETSFSL